MESRESELGAGPDRVAPTGRALAVAVVVLSSAAVLVLEVLAVRLVAPYAGLTLETYTASIGVTLGAIAVGAALGGRSADIAVRPAGLVGPLLVGGGALFMLARPAVLAVGPGLRDSGPGGAVVLISLAVVMPVAVLSAVPPIVVKTQLARLDDTGTVVGRFSALGTLGALGGTFLTGFVLLATLPVSRVLLFTGAALVLLGAVQIAWRRSTLRRTATAAALVVLAATALVTVADDCDYETAYYCARVEADPARGGGRVLYLDNLRHAYVDLDDPTYLEFAYTKRFASVIDAMAPPGEPLRALHLGGGGFTVPRWLAATRPGSRSEVLELDPVVVRLAREKLGLRTGPDLSVHAGDARMSMTSQRAATYDLVVGDAFGSLSVPWHLATREFLREIRRVLRPGGVYVSNVIDNPPLAFLAAELATVQDVFGDVAVLASRTELDGEQGANYIIVAGQVPDRATLARAAARRGEPGGVATDAQLAVLRRGGHVLTDDDAPVDQLFNPYG